MGKKGVERIIVGADDSNHAGTAKGEIIVAAFSFLPEDALVKKFPNVRDFRATEHWLDSPNRDYRYAILTAKKYRHSSQNLVEIVPFLIKGYLDEQDLDVKILSVFLDGRLAGGNRGKIRGDFLGFRGIENIVVDNFIKKKHTVRGKVEKHPECPAVVYHADIIANYLYSTTLENPKLIFRD
jgi:hypothetical protein